MIWQEIVYVRTKEALHKWVYGRTSRNPPKNEILCPHVLKPFYGS